MFLSAQTRAGLVRRLARWWREWAGRRDAVVAFDGCDRAETARIARPERRRGGVPRSRRQMAGFIGPSRQVRWRMTAPARSCRLQASPFSHNRRQYDESSCYPQKSES